MKIFENIYNTIGRHYLKFLLFQIKNEIKKDILMQLNTNINKEL